ncbi:uncharacterized protein TNIN_167971 [Trichonephila inaurata madagascariensis]|uniref:Uncharacterized protein n=1 Tax=Trichonephila inaurata madagascariensis TaxID=2747483 RepID=A0A8X6IQF3_9ARAC|nr:uncharacterized protein TNIN_167971 [Trichonephila inaurata madagascariensis]
MIWAKFTRLEQFETPSCLELRFQLNYVSALRNKVKLLRKDYYSLPSDVDLTEVDRKLELLEDRLYKTEVRFHFLLSKLDNANVSMSEVIREENNVLSGNEGRQTSIKLPEIPLPQFSGLYEEWSTFKDQFDNLISNNEKLTNSQKLLFTLRS